MNRTLKTATALLLTLSMAGCDSSGSAGTFHLYAEPDLRQRIQKHPQPFGIKRPKRETEQKRVPKGAQFVDPFSSAYIGTVEGGSADSRKIPIKIRFTMRIFSL
ncbi:MAG: hypothetical protein IJC46_08110 [Clostridia bacterium]|nr:hypothetical protein [Clostridia bacterium]